MSEAEITGAAEALANAFETSWNRQDGPAYGSAYWEDAELVDPTGAIWTGREAIRAMHVELWRGPASATTVDARVRKVRRLAPGLLIVDIEVTVSGFDPPPPGAVVDADGNVHTRLKHVVEKRGNQWKILASQNTFVVVGLPGG